MDFINDIQSKIKAEATRLESIAKESNPSVEIALHGNPQAPTLAIKLHNSGLRPTVYTVEPKIGQYQCLAGVTIDTIICELKTHKCFKKNFNTLEQSFKELEELIAQPATGTVGETMQNYTPIGLLYRQNTPMESIVL